MSSLPVSNGELRGVITPLATPLDERQTLDSASLARLVEHVLSGGVHGLFILGSTGEGPSLSLDLRLTIIRQAAQLVAGRVPFVVNVSETAFEHSLNLADQAAQCGASAVALSPTSYFTVDQHQLSAYFVKFASRSPLPVFVYNIPQFAHTAVSPQTMCRLAEEPNIVGMKNSDGSLDYLRAVKSGLPRNSNFKLLVGNEETFLPALLAGAHGGVTGGANMFPKIFVDLYKTATEGRRSEAEHLQKVVFAISNAVYQTGPRDTSYLRGLKRALSILGLLQDVLAEPLQTFDPTTRAEFDSRFAQLRETLMDAKEINARS